MKFFATAALIVAVQAACEKEGDDYICDPAENKCLKRVTVDVSNPKDKNYKNAIKEDPELAKGSVKFMCVVPDDATAFLSEETNNKKDKRTVTLAYTDMTPADETKSGAFKIKGAFIAATLGLIAYM